MNCYKSMLRASLMACFLIMIAVPAARAQGNFIRGDANCDRLVDTNDVNLLVEVIFHGDSLSCLAAGDVNDNGTVTTGDIDYLLLFLFSGGPPPPPPFPGCGPGPSVLPCLSSCCLPVFLRGDIDCDGDVDSTDLSILTDFVFTGTGDLTCLAAADINDNLSVTSADLIPLTELVFGGGTPLPPPYPYYGTDPTSLPCNDCYTCPIEKTGNVNGDTSITAGDIIYCVNYTFKGGPAPIPCPAAADVTCNRSVTSLDIIYLINYTFKSGVSPCDVCTLFPRLWLCP